jgi:hypothetical protein
MTRLKTLILDGNGAGIKTIGFTTVRGLFGLDEKSKLPFGLHRNPLIYNRLLARQYRVYSYINDWREAFVLSPRLDATVCDINDVLGYRKSLKHIADYDLIVLLHSATCDHMHILNRTRAAFDKRRGKMVVFFSNEYEWMAEKAAFVDCTSAEYVCTQLQLDVAKWIYKFPSDQMIATPHALNQRLYQEPTAKRDVDVGFIGTLYHDVIGDRERTNLIEYARDRGELHGLTTDFRLRNVPREEWAAFLGRCRGTVGAESGTYFLDHQAKTMDTVRRMMLRDKTLTFDEIWTDDLKRDKEFVSGKAISSRHFEPIGTKTCQVLIEGDYNGILKADEHYIAVKKDLSNVGEALEKFKDETFRERIVQQAYDFVLAEHTYDKRVEAVVDRVEGAR